MSMTRQILVPIDDSEHAREALNHALDDFSDDAITVIHVLEPSDLYAYSGTDGIGMINFEEIQTQREEMAEQLLDEAKEHAETRGVTVSTDIETGPVERTVVEYAAEHGIDQIVIGSHGRSGASRILLGSVAESVARRSPVPVTIVR